MQGALRRPRGPTRTARVEGAAARLAERLLGARSVAEASSAALEAALGLTASDGGAAGLLDTQAGAIAFAAESSAGGRGAHFGADPWVREPSVRRAAEDAGPRKGWVLIAPALAGDAVVGRLGLHRRGRRFAAGEVAGVARLAGLFGLALSRLSFEERLAASPALDETLFDSHPDGVAIVSDGRLARVSPAFADLLGRRSEEILGRSPTEFVVAEEHEAVRTRMATAQGGTPERPSEYRVIRPDGSFLRAEAVTRVIAWEGRPAFLVVFRDVSRRKEVEEELRRRERLLGRLAEFDAIISHLSTEKILRGALSYLLPRCGADRLGVLTLEACGRWSVVAATEGEGGLGLRVGDRISLPGTLTGAAVEDRAPVYAPDYPRAWGGSSVGREVASAGLGSAFVLPLASGGAVLGTLNVGSRGLDGFDEEVREFLTLVAPRLAAALENSMLFEERERGERRFRTIYDTLPVSIWEEDFSALQVELDRLRAEGIGDIRSYLRANPDFLVRLAALVRVEDVNDYTLRLYGAKDRSELVGSLHRVFSPESYPVFAELVATLYEGAPFFESEGVNRTLAGEALAVMVRGQFSPGGNSRATVSITDITARQRAEARLRRRMELENFVATLSSRLIDLGPGQVEAGVRQALGSLGEFLGADRVFAFRISEDHSRVDGSIEWPSRAGEPILAGAEGSPLGAVPWLERIVLGAEGLTVTRTGELPPEAAAGCAAAEALGVTSLAVAPIVAGGRTVGALGVGAAGENGRWSNETLALLRTVGELLFNSLGRERAELELRGARDELERRVEERTADLERAKRELEADIAARERAEAEMRHLERELRQSRVLEAVGHLAGGVAHDFNNILGSVIGCLYAAKLRAGGDATLLEELDRAQSLCKRGGDLTRQLLTVARRRPGMAERVELGSLLAEVRVLLERTLPRVIALRVSPPDRPLTVEVDRASLTASLLNLALNARDAMPGGGELRVGARPLDAEGRPWVALEVSDSGPGVPEELQERIFDPFFTTKPPGKGSGLGLSTVAATVREFGGRIGLSSREGGGASFTLLLPASGRDPALGAAGSVRGEHPLTPLTVLVVEDEGDLARMVSSVLRSEGYATLEASTGLEALELVRDHREELGLVALDLVLPELGGAEVHRLLRGLAPEIPVLVVTGREDLARTLGPGVPFLPKPFTPAELLAAVQRALEGRT